MMSRYPNSFPLGRIVVAQYSVHAQAGLEPDDGIHRPNIRSPEGWQKTMPGLLALVPKSKGRDFRKGFLSGCPRFRGLIVTSRGGALTYFFYYFNFNRLARLMFCDGQI